MPPPFKKGPWNGGAQGGPRVAGLHKPQQGGSASMPVRRPVTGQAQQQGGRGLSAPPGSRIQQGATPNQHRGGTTPRQDAPGPSPAEPKLTGSSTDLPVDEARAKVVQMVRENKACIIVGETGSGKTTRIPQFVLDDMKDVLKDGTVCCTQPRRVAATTIATYVAKCRGCKIGDEVGYAVRFDEAVSKNTRLKFVTDGILLRELLQDPLLKRYKCIILDEAHERTLHGDVLFGLLKSLSSRRPDLRIVVMSATLNAEQFSNFWGGAPVGYVTGRTFPVEVFYAKEPQLDYVDAAINGVIQAHLEEPFPGDILCFLTGQDEIDAVKGVLDERRKLLPPGTPDMFIVPLYSAMTPAAQMRAFEKAPKGFRKIVLATNIAETSITIEGIKYVVDTCVVKVRDYDPATTVDSLTVQPESRAQARQRSGRAGRVSAGKCYRLVTEESFREDMNEIAVPEILRCALGAVVLQMKAMGIDNILGFNFMDSPSKAGLLRAQQQLAMLGAIDAETGNITQLGREIVKFPTDPMAARAIIRGIQLGVAADVCAVIAMLSADGSLFTATHNSGGGAAIENRSKFMKSLGDQVTLLHVFDSYRRQPVKERSHWCEASGLNSKQMQRTLDVFVQLMEVAESVRDDEGRPRDVKRNRSEASSAGLAAAPLSKHDAEREHESMRTALAAGYFTQAAFFSHQQNTYLTLIGQRPVYIHPSSVLFRVKNKPPLVLFHSVVSTTKNFMREVVSVRDEFLQAAAPALFGGRTPGQAA